MGNPAATANSQVLSVDTHIVLVPTPGGPVPTPLPHPFSGMINGNTVSTVKLGGQAAAVVGSTATNSPSHVPIAAGDIVPEASGQPGNGVHGKFHGENRWQVRRPQRRPCDHVQ